MSAHAHMTLAAAAAAVAGAVAVADPALAGAGSARVGPVTDAATARAWLDAAFAEHHCHMTEAELLSVMRQEGQSPRNLGAAGGSVSADKLMRHRRIFHELQVLRASGEVCVDPADPSLSISKFGGCAA